MTGAYLPGSRRRRPALLRYGSVKPDIRLLPGRASPPRPAGYRDQVEETNRRIVSLLSHDGRMSFTELARHAGLPLTAFVSITPFDPAAPDDAPQRLAHLSAIEACHSVAGDENYILKVRVASPAALEDLLQEIRSAAGVSTRTTIVLSTPYENRPPDV